MILRVEGLETFKNQTSSLRFLAKTQVNAGGDEVRSFQLYIHPSEQGKLIELIKECKMPVGAYSAFTWSAGTRVDLCQSQAYLHAIVGHGTGMIWY